MKVASRNTTDLFEGAAGNWAARYRTRRSLVARLQYVAPEIRKELELQRSNGAEAVRVLDFGSGPGVFAAVASDLAERVTCIDRSSYMLAGGENDVAVLSELAERAGGTYRPDRIERVVGDETQLDSVAPGSYQLVLAIAVLEYVPSPLTVLGDFLRCLSHDGVLLFTTPNRASVLRRIEPPINAISTRIGGKGGIERLSQRACTGSSKTMRNVDVVQALADLDARVEDVVSIPLAVGGPLHLIKPNTLFRVRHAGSRQARPVAS